MSRDLVLVIVMVFLFAAQTLAGQSSVATVNHDRNLTEAQIQFDASDIKYLSQVSIQGDSTELRRVLDVPSVSPTDLMSWLKQHVPKSNGHQEPLASGIFGSGSGPQKDSAGHIHRIARLNQLFHFARHMGADGKPTAYKHVMCPRGHELAGTRACDRDSNGANTVSYLVTKNLTESCSTCTSSEKDALRALYLDAKNRVISDTPVDHQKETRLSETASVAKNMLKTCELLRALPGGVPTSSRCIPSQIAEYKKTLAAAAKSKISTAHPNLSTADGDPSREGI